MSLAFKNHWFSLAIRVFKLALPFTTIMLANYCLLLTDTAFIGHYKNPAIGLAAISNVLQPHYTIVAIIAAFSQGITVMISKAIGAKDLTKAAKIAESSYFYTQIISFFFFFVWFFGGHTILTLMNTSGPVLTLGVQYTKILAFTYLGMGLLFTSVSVLQAVEKAHFFVYGSIIQAALNVLLDWTLIFGHWGMPELGIQGAALATTISSLTGGVVVVILTFAHAQLPLKVWRIFHARWVYFWQSMKIGLPSCGETFLYSLAQFLLIALLNSQNPLSSAYYGLVNNMIYISFYLYLGIGNACLTLTANAHGARNLKSIILYSFLCNILALISCLIISAFYLLFPSAIVGMLTKDDALVAAITTITPLIIMGLFPKQVNVLLASSIRGLGKAYWLFNSQIIGTILTLLVGFYFIYVEQLSIIGFLLAILVDEIFRSVLNAAYFIHLTKKMSLRIF